MMREPPFIGAVYHETTVRETNRSGRHHQTQGRHSDMFGNYPFQTWLVIPAKAGIHSGGLSD